MCHDKLDLSFDRLYAAQEVHHQGRGPRSVDEGIEQGRHFQHVRTLRVPKRWCDAVNAMCDAVPELCNAVPELCAAV